MTFSLSHFCHHTTFLFFPSSWCAVLYLVIYLVSLLFRFLVFSLALCSSSSSLDCTKKCGCSSLAVDLMAMAIYWLCMPFLYLSPWDESFCTICVMSLRLELARQTGWGRGEVQTIWRKSLAAFERSLRDGM